MPRKTGKLRPEKGKALFKAPSELVAGSRLESRSLIPSLGLAQALPLSECSRLVSWCLWRWVEEGSPILVGYGRGSGSCPWSLDTAVPWTALPCLRVLCPGGLHHFP